MFSFKLGAVIYCTAVLEYLVAEVLDLAGDAASANKFQRIKPRHISLAIFNDEELMKLLANVTISQGGILPHIHPDLLPKRTPKKAKASKKITKA
jgi:histone H2A